MAGNENSGRKTLYDEVYNEQAYKLCLLGATDEELADFFQVHIDTIYEWKKVNIKFSEAVTRGKIIADAEVANSFYNRARGYDLPTEKIFQSEGSIIRADTITHYPADAGAALNWLKNRQPKKWRDKTDVEHSGDVVLNHKEHKRIVEDYSTPTQEIPGTDV